MIRSCQGNGQIAENFRKVWSGRISFRYVFAELHEKNPEWYEIILGMDIAGCPAAKMARKLGITENNLRVKRHRAKIWLRKEFGIEIQELLLKISFSRTPESERGYGG